MDRTPEFFGWVNVSSPAGLSTLATPKTKESAVDVVNEQQFSKLTGAIYLDFDECQTNLAELESLAKKRSLYDEKSEDVQKGTFKIKAKLTSLNGRVDDIEKLCKSLPSSGSPGSQHAATHRQIILSNLRTRLMDLTRELAQILQARSKNLAKLDQRRTLFGQSSVSALNLGTTGASSHAPVSLNRRTFNSTNEKSDEPSNIDLESGTQQQIFAPSHAYHQSRAEAVEQIQRIVGELSTMFSRVAAMVGHQEEMVMRIDATVDDSLVRLREGQVQLLKYFNKVVSQRALILKILGMILAFAAFFIIFLA